MSIVTFFNNAVVFSKQVRQEISKITWPTRSETLKSTGLVLVMVAITSLFFCIIDLVALAAVQFILQLGS